MESELDDESLTSEEREDIIDSYLIDIYEIKEKSAELNEELENI